ncbi:permease [Methanoplanus sp. FWC-SCC4]|uniref:Permease n=1 Tax=Methanochimaera problematica TaxID=2609417 RepID=A0AA97I4L7_9EURY|nr:permease [Methanoplanus sp. FWC-SCC4]WOF16634.1 permease [Methanoplanus sp. FWC-SCC4]
MIDLITGSLLMGWDTLLGYLSEHVVTCLIPAFFIAGAIAALVKKEAILKYFSPDAKKSVAYGLASVSGTVLAVCSCTILPMFAGLFKRGSGIGPATTFLYAGPAINILAIVYTAKVLGFDLGLARAVFAIILAIVIGLIMAFLFRSHDRETKKKMAEMPVSPAPEVERPKWIIPLFFVFLVGILIAGTAQADWMIKFPIIYLFTLGAAVLLIYFFDRDEVTDWGLETWDLTKKIFPILIVGTFVLGMLAFFLPPETFQPFFGTNSIESTMLASFIGTILYMPTLLEVPVIGTTFGYTSGIMAGGPALSLLLSGPSVSLPSLLVISRIMGWKKTGVYALLVIVFSGLAGFAYGLIIG